MSAETSPAPARDAPLDEIMLAMDVVDTLRHREELIQRELDTDGQGPALVARVQQIYASQGMEVSERVVADAIQALREDRFVYKPPRRTFGIRLAEVYVERAKWARRVLVATVLGVAAVVSWQAAPVAVRSWRDHAVSRDVAQLAILRADIEGRAKAVAARLEREAEHVPELVEQPAASLIDQTRSELARAASTVAAVDADGLVRPGVADGRGLEAWRRAARRDREALEQARVPLGAAETAVAGLVDLKRVASTAEGERQSILATARDEPAKQEAARRWDRVRASLERGDAPAATSALEDLKALRGELALAYELRVVSRPREPTGIWRRPRSNASARNYYIVVEPLVGGHVIELPVLSEETHEVKRVRRFGVRVPEAVYERLRADKADDGLLRDDRFGEKRPGELAPQYRYPVVGGFITDW